ncbi:MAG: DUF6273 domain-containing protein [Clostridia bacterium]
MKTVKLGDLERGSLFCYGGIKWAMLNLYVGYSLCISAEVVGKRTFDDGGLNDFTNSSLRAWLNGKFLNGLLENGAKEDAFKDLHLDLTSDDGLDDYGTDIVTIGLITRDVYRAYRRYIPRAAEWWWTCTPCSTEKGLEATKVRIVFTKGSLNGTSAYDGRCGVRPICSLHYDTLVSVEDGD